MGWTFKSFDVRGWSRWMSGALTPAHTTRLQAAMLLDAESWSAAEVDLREGLVERVATLGIDLAYQEARGSELETLDQLVGSLFLGEELSSELHPVGHLDPWSWNSIEALVQRVAEQSPARLLLTGRRPGGAAATGPSGSPFVIFTPDEALVLAMDLASAMRTPPPASAEWEVEQFVEAMGEMTTEAARGRGVFADYG